MFAVPKYWRERERRESAVDLASAVPFVAAGVVAGVVAFVPFLAVLKPVLDGNQNADMLKGMVSLAVSAIALLAFTLIVFAVFGVVFQMFLLGEAVGFVGFMLAFTAVLLKRLGNSR